MTEYQVRVRGRVSGPFTIDKLQKLVRTGNLKRIHQLSSDGQNWINAAELAELFPPTAIQAADEEPESTGLSAKGSELTLEPMRTTGPAPTQDSQWYAIVDGQQIGPMPLHDLKIMYRARQLSPATFVWHSGLADWTAIDSLPQFNEFNEAPVSVQTAHDSKATRSHGVVDMVGVDRALGGARWLTFLCITGALTALIMGSCGVGMAAIGINRHQPLSVASGLFTLVYAGLLGGGSYLLDQVRRTLVRLQRQNDTATVNRLIAVIYSMSVYCSVLVIIFLSFTAVFFIWGFSFGSTIWPSDL